MAERSIIDGFGPGVKKWASEETASAIAKTLSDIHGLTKEQTKEIAKLAGKAGSGSSKKNDKAFKELEDSMRDLDDATEENTEAKEDNTEATRGSTKSTSLFSSMLGKASSALGSMFVTAIGATAGAMFKQADLAVQLNQSGIQLATGTKDMASGLSSFGIAAAEANLSFSELANLSKEYGAVINKYGIQAFAETSNRVTKNLRDLGITSDESAEMVAEYLQARRFMTYQEQLTQQQQTRAATEMIKQLDEMGMAFGESRKELMKSVTQSLQQVDVQAFLKTQSGAVRGVFEDMSTQLAGQDFQGLQQSLMQAMANPITQQTELFQALAAGGATDAMNSLTGLAEAARQGDSELASVRFDEFMSSLRNSDVELSQLIGEQGQMLRDYINQSKIHYDMMNDAERQQERATLARLAEAQNGFRELSQFFQRVASGVLADQRVIDALNESLESLTSFLASPEGKAGIESMQSAFANLISSFAPAVKKAIPYITATFEKLTEWAQQVEDFTEGSDITDLFDFSSIPMMIGKGLLIAITAGAGVALIAKGITAGISKLLGNIAFGKTGKGGIFGSMFKGLGKGVGGALSALAKGLSAFGKAGPAVLKGAGILSAVIVLIGGAIAGATWMMGKALPTMAEGLQAFDAVDGDNLAKVGKGAMQLGAGLLAMTSSKIGNYFANLGESIFEFFGGETVGPIDLLNKFASAATEVGPGLNQLGSALQNFVPYMSEFIESAGKMKNLDMSQLQEYISSFSQLDVSSTEVTAAPTITIDTRKLDFGKVEQQINETVDRTVPGEVTKTVKMSMTPDSSPEEMEEYLKYSISNLYKSLDRAQERGQDRVAGKIQKRINRLNDQLTGATMVNGHRLSGEAVTGIKEDAEAIKTAAKTVNEVADVKTESANKTVDNLSQIGNNVTRTLSPKDIARLENRRGALTRFIEKAHEMGKGNMTGVKKAQERIDAINMILSQQEENKKPEKNFTDVVGETGLFDVPAKIDESADSLSVALNKYFEELKRLESFKPISASSRVENSPMVPDSQNAKQKSKKPQYQSVQYTKPPMQVEEIQQEDTETAQSKEQKNPEISKTNVAQNTPKSESEINSLIKEQNKILSGLSIAMETNNKRLKSLVRINEEKGT